MKIVRTCLLLALSALILSLGIGAAYAAPSVCIDPASSPVANAGDSFDVDVLVDPAGEELAGGTVELSFDASVLSITAHSPGTIFSSSSDMGSEWSTPGYAKINLAAMGCTATTPGTWAAITFEVADGTLNGTYDIEITSATLKYGDTTVIPGTTVTNGTVTVGTPGLTMNVAADPTSVVNGTTTAVTFNVTSEGTAVDGALVTLLGCGVDTNGTTDATGTVTISVTANATGTIGVTATKTGYDEAATGVDVNPAPTNTYYRDADEDGYGNASDSIEADSAPDGYVTDNTDCDDDNAAVNPGATEVCNGIDDDCDNLVDDADPDCVGMTTYYADADGDTYGDPAVSQDACAAPAGYVTNNTDCDDTNADVNPGATEVRNGIDDDCDGSVDEGCPIISSATLSPNVIKSDGTDSATLTVLATDEDGIASVTVTVNLSAIGGPDEQTLDPLGSIMQSKWTTTIRTNSTGTFVLPVTATDDDGSSATTDVTLTAGPNTYTLSLKQGWNMIALPCNVTAVGIDTTQKLGDLITGAGEDCYYVAWFDATSQTMVSDIISPPEGVPQDTTNPISVGQGYFVLVADDLDVVVAGTQW